MKKSLLTSIFIMFLLLLTSGAAFAQEGAIDFASERNQFAFSLGIYSPAEDSDDPYDDEWETGGDFTATYTRLITSRFAIETGLHSYVTTFDEGNVEAERSTGGIEVMFLYVPIHTRIMPYIGGGLGFYANDLLVEVNGSDVIDDSGNAVGVVLKGGVRAHMTQRFFLGGFLKVFTNNQEVEFENGDEETMDFGGSSVNFEVGFAF